MPTTLYAKDPIGSVSFKGKEYAVVKGKVEVPDDAVSVLVESHGFTTDPIEADDAEGDDKTPSLEEMTKAQLLDFAKLNFEKELPDLKTSMTKEEIYGQIKAVLDEKDAA